MARLAPAIKRFFLDKPGDPYWLRFAKTTLLVVPVVTFFMSMLFTGGIPSFLSYFFSLLIADTVAVACFASVGGLGQLRRWVAARKQVAPPPSRLWQVTVGMLGMVPGMYLGCRLAEMIFAHYGHPWKVTGVANYTSGYLFGTGILAITALAELHEENMEMSRRMELELARAENERLQAQISALTAQMNPHLLFNALNTVAAMIPEDPARAEEMTVLLADLYRGVLDSSRRSTHSLATELAICRAYLAVEQARYGERLGVQLTIDDSMRPAKVEIPVLIVQPLVENAIRHGIAPRASGGKVIVRAESREGRLRIRVEDDGMGIGNAPRSKGAGTGISNCRARLQLQYGDEGTLEVIARERGTVATIELPLGEGRV